MTCTLVVEREGRSLPRTQLLRRDPEQFVRGADGHEMTSAFHLMPYCSGHSVSHLLVDESRHESIIRSLPHVDRPLDRAYVEGPAPIEQLTVANQPIAALSKAFRARFAEGGIELRRPEEPLIVLVYGLTQLLDVRRTEVLGGDAHRRVHEAEPGLEMQREESAQRVDLGE